MARISLGRCSSLPRRSGAASASGRRCDFLRAGMLRVRTGALARYLHKGRVGMLHPTPPTIKLESDVEVVFLPGG